MIQARRLALQVPILYGRSLAQRKVPPAARSSAGAIRDSVRCARGTRTIVNAMIRRSNISDQFLIEVAADPRLQVRVAAQVVDLRSAGDPGLHQVFCM
jgi:hypothetical protein